MGIFRFSNCKSRENKGIYSSGFFFIFKHKKSLFFHYDFHNFFFYVSSCFILIKVCKILFHKDFFMGRTVVQMGKGERNDG